MDIVLYTYSDIHQSYRFLCSTSVRSRNTCYRYAYITVRFKSRTKCHLSCSLSTYGTVFFQCCLIYSQSFSFGLVCICNKSFFVYIRHSRNIYYSTCQKSACTRLGGRYGKFILFKQTYHTHLKRLFLLCGINIVSKSFLYFF